MNASLLSSSSVGLCLGSLSYLVFAAHSLHRISEKTIHVAHPLLKDISKGYGLPKVLVATVTALALQVSIQEIEKTLLVPAFLSHMTGIVFFLGSGFVLTRSLFDHFPLPDKSVNKALNFYDRYFISPPRVIVNNAEAKIKEHLTPKNYTDDP